MIFIAEELNSLVLVVGRISACGSNRFCPMEKDFLNRDLYKDGRYSTEFNFQYCIIMVGL